MDDFFAGDAHDVTAKLAYQLWEQKGPLYGITLDVNEGPFLPADQQIKSGSH